MTDQIQSLRDDLAFLKTVASDEGRLPWSLGTSFLAAGVIFGLPVAAAWAQVRGLVAAGPWQLWMWIGATVLFTGFQLALTKLGPKPQPGASLGRAFLPTWSGMGLITVVMVTVFFIAAARLHLWSIFEIWAAVCFALWGGAWWGVAMLRPGRGWMWVALGSFATAIANALLIGSSNEILGCALGVMVWLGAPGLMIMLNAPAKT